MNFVLTLTISSGKQRYSSTPRSTEDWKRPGPFTASLDVQMGVFLRNLKALGYTYGGKDFTFSIDSSVENSSKLMTYENMNSIDAMFSMAEKWGCDCWVTDHVINFGRCEFSDAVTIELWEGG